MNKRREKGFFSRLGYVGFALVLATCSSITSPVVANAEHEAEKLGYENDLLNLLCADQGVWLECYHQEPTKCREVLRPLVHGCVTPNLEGLKMPINLQTGLERNVKIIECLNQEFPKTVGAKRKDEARCKEQPKHLK